MKTVNKTKSNLPNPNVGPNADENNPRPELRVDKSSGRKLKLCQCGPASYKFSIHALLPDAMGVSDAIAVCKELETGEEIVQAVNEYDALNDCLLALEAHQRDGECYCVNKGEGNTSGNPCAHCKGKEALATLSTLRFKLKT